MKLRVYHLFLASIVLWAGAIYLGHFIWMAL